MTDTATTNPTTAAEFRAEAQTHRDEAHASFERCDTDGFVSQWASDLNARKATLNADIADNGGTAEFPALFTLDGNWTPAKRIEGTYGPRWLVLDNDGHSTGEFLPYMPARRSTLSKHGYTEGYAVHPAKADLWSPRNARGLSGATSVQVVTVRTVPEHTEPLAIVTTDRFDGLETLPKYCGACQHADGRLVLDTAAHRKACES